MRPLETLRTGVLLGCLFLCADAAVAQCISLNVYDPDGFGKGKSISVGLFELEGGRVVYNGRLETPRQVLLESLLEDLQKSRLFSAVKVVAGDETPDTDYALQGEIRGLEGGNQVIRILTGRGAGQMRVSGRLLAPARHDGSGASSREVIADWECNSFDLGGSFGVGDNERAAKENADKIASSLTKNVFGNMSKRIGKVEQASASDADKDAVRGETKPRTREWREKAVWEADDYADEIDSFVVKSERERARAVDALWLTAASYQAHQKLLPMLAQTAILKGGDIRRGMLTELAPLASLEGEDVYVLAVTFTVSSGQAPFIWRSADIRTSTFLRRAGSGDERIAPVQFLDRAIPPYAVYRENKVFKRFADFWGSHPVLMAFPARRADGTPWLTDVDDTLELHTVVDGRRYVSTFNLQHFGLRSLDDLRMTPARSDATTASVNSTP